MTPEQRLDRVERILGIMAKSGREARSEFRQKINIITNMHLQNEEQWRAQAAALNEKINILIHSQMQTTEQIKGLGVDIAELTESQKLTDRTLRDFIDSLRKRGNGKSST